MVSQPVQSFNHRQERNRFTMEVPVMGDSLRWRFSMAGKQWEKKNGIIRFSLSWWWKVVLAEVPNTNWNVTSLFICWVQPEWQDVFITRQECFLICRSLSMLGCWLGLLVYSSTPQWKSVLLILVEIITKLKPQRITDGKLHVSSGTTFVKCWRREQK